MDSQISIVSRFSRQAWAILVGCALLAACTEAPAPAQHSRPAPTADAEEAATRIVVLGDSIAAGLGLAQSEAFPAVTERLLRDAGHEVTLVNAGVSGDTSAGGLSRLDWVLRQGTQILVVELGGNDALRGQPIDSTERSLRQIVQRARAQGVEVLLLGMDIPSNYGPDYTASFAALYERVAADEGVPLVPGFVREVGMDPELLQPDGLHPNAAGHERLAARLVPFLEEILQRTSDPDAATDTES